MIFLEVYLLVGLVAALTWLRPGVVVIGGTPMRYPSRFRTTQLGRRSWLTAPAYVGMQAVAWPAFTWLRLSGRIPRHRREPEEVPQRRDALPTPDR